MFLVIIFNANKLTGSLITLALILSKFKVLSCRPLLPSPTLPQRNQTHRVPLRVLRQIHEWYVCKREQKEITFNHYGSTIKNHFHKSFK